MDERVVKFRVGVMVLMAMLLAGIMMLRFGNVSTLGQNWYTIFVKFPQAPGVTQETPVRKSGILIGRVEAVQFEPDGGVRVTLWINANVQLRVDETCVISTSILGDSVLQFVPPPEGPRATQLLADGDYIQGRVATDPLQLFSNLEGNFGQAMGSFSTASEDLGKLARNLNNLLLNNEEQLTRIVTKTEGTLDSVRRAMGNMEGLLGDERLRNNLRDSIEELPELLKQTRQAMTGIQTTLASADRNLRNLEGFSKPLGERGEGMVARIDQTVARLDELLGQFVKFGENLNNPEGSLGRLMNDPEFYQHLNATVLNIEKLTCELQPIVRDARVFTDKIARHPEVLGVGGALQRSPGFK